MWPQVQTGFRSAASDTKGPRSRRLAPSLRPQPLPRSTSEGSATKIKGAGSDLADSLLPASGQGARSETESAPVGRQGARDRWDRDAPPPPPWRAPGSWRHSSIQKWPLGKNNVSPNKHHFCILLTRPRRRRRRHRGSPRRLLQGRRGEAVCWARAAPFPVFLHRQREAVGRDRAEQMPYSATQGDRTATYQ